MKNELKLLSKSLSIMNDKKAHLKLIWDKPYFFYYIYLYIQYIYKYNNLELQKGVGKTELPRKYNRLSLPEALAARLKRDTREAEARE